MGDTLTLRLYITRGAKLCHSTRDLVGYYPKRPKGIAP